MSQMYDDDYAERVAKYRKKDPWEHYDDPLFAEKFAKYQKQYPGKGNIFGIHELARNSYKDHMADPRRGDFVGKAPAQREQDVVDPFPGRAPGAGSMPAGPQQASGGGGPVSDEDYLQQLFGGVGGLGEGRARGEGEDEAAEAGPAQGPKMGGWARTGSFFKGLGNLLTLPLVSALSFGAAGIHRLDRWMTGRTHRKMQKTNTDRLDDKGKRAFTSKMAKNQVSHENAQRRLGTSRRLYTGRSMVDHFKEAFTGRSWKVGERRQDFFSGGQFNPYADDPLPADGANPRSTSGPHDLREL